MATDSLTDRVPLGAGAAVGSAGWVLGYLFPYLVASGDIENSLFGRVLEAAEIGIWRVVGWVVYNAHFLNTTAELGFLGSGAVYAIGGDSGFTALLYAVSPLLLVGAGLSIRRYTGVGDAGDANAAAAGASVVFGYAPLSVGGLLVFATDRVSPDPGTAVLLAGLLHPVGFGAVGAFVALATQDSA